MAPPGQFTFILDPNLKQRLTDVAVAMGVSRGTVLRWAVLRLAAMVLDGKPHCADGRPCICPLSLGYTPIERREHSAQTELPGVKGITAPARRGFEE